MGEQAGRSTDVDPDTSPTDTASNGTPAVTAIGVVAVLLIGLCLVTADRLDESAGTRVLAVLAVGAAMLALVAAGVGQMIAAPASTSRDDRRRRGVRTITGSGVLAGLAVVLASSAAILVVLRQDARRPDAPELSFTLAGEPGRTTLAVRLALPDLAEGSLMDATLTGMTHDATQQVLARAVVPADTHGVAEARLVADADDQYRNVVVQARTQRRTCRATLSLVEPMQEAPTLECQTSS